MAESFMTHISVETTSAICFACGYDTPYTCMCQFTHDKACDCIPRECEECGRSFGASVQIKRSVMLAFHEA